MEEVKGLSGNGRDWPAAKLELVGVRWISLVFSGRGVKLSWWNQDL